MNEKRLSTSQIFKLAHIVEATLITDSNKPEEFGKIKTIYTPHEYTKTSLKTIEKLEEKGMIRKLGEGYIATTKGLHQIKRGSDGELKRYSHKNVNHIHNPKPLGRHYIKKQTTNLELQ